MKSPLPSPERLHQLLEFREVADEHSSSNIHVFWRARSESSFKTTHDYKIWNSKFLGRRIGCEITRANRGTYLHTHVDGQHYLVHRLIWHALRGEVTPDDEIDHIDGNGLNNSLANLRRCSRIQNNYNQKLRSNNTSGAVGVRWAKRQERWQAHITLGSFKSKSDAIAARDQAAQLWFGEFARLNDPVNQIDPCLIGCSSVDT